MKELDNNFIEAFAAQYWNQEVIMVKDYDDLMTIMDFSLGAKCFDYEIEYINLRSIDDLTDEEVKMLGWETVRDVKSLLYDDFLYLSDYDNLRSIGIAVPFRGVSVETIIESGKLKLRKS